MLNMSMTKKWLNEGNNKKIAAKRDHVTRTSDI